MSQNTQSKILSIEEQIKKLQDKKKREITKLERSTGKRLLEKFNLENKSLNEIYTFIDTLEELTKDSLPNESESVVTNGQSAQ